MKIISILKNAIKCLLKQFSCFFVILPLAIYGLSELNKIRKDPIAGEKSKPRAKLIIYVLIGLNALYYYFEYRQNQQVKNSAISLTTIATQVKSQSNLPLIVDEGMTWQDIYAEGEKLVYVFLFDYSVDEFTLYFAAPKNLADTQISEASEVLCKQNNVAYSWLKDVPIVYRYIFKDEEIKSYVRFLASCQ